MKIKEIDYKKQLEYLKKAVHNFYIDNCMTNTFDKFEEGHKKATLSISKDMEKIVDMALKGKLKDVGEPEIVHHVMKNIISAEKAIKKYMKGKVPVGEKHGR